MTPKPDYTKPPGGLAPLPAGPGTDVRPQTSFDVDLYQVRSGDSYESISREYYNDTRYARALAEYNRRKPLTGGHIEVPPIHILRKYYSQLIGGTAVSPSPSPGVTAPVNFVPTGRPDDAAPQFRPSGGNASGPKTYRVAAQGINIPAVAKQTLGTDQRWKEIWDLNPQITKPGDYLPIGTELRLPPDAKLPE
jgi:nucleoid-associated protein YgaU